jgi:hypothetical protein
MKLSKCHIFLVILIFTWSSSPLETKLFVYINALFLSPFLKIPFSFVQFNGVTSQVVRKRVYGSGVGRWIPQK